VVTAKFDIIVPTYNRYNDLPEFFARNAKLEHAPAMIWVIDDHSSLPERTAIPAWKNIEVISLKQNMGQAFARNVGIERGEAPYVISLDDDAWFEDVERSLRHLEELFLTDPTIGCVMFNIATPRSAYCDLPTGTRLGRHVTCGCAYRREALRQVKGFSGFLHSQAEETDLSIRLHQRGWSIVFSKEVRVFHNFNPGKRSLTWYYNQRHNTARNDLLIVAMYYPWTLVAPFVAGKYLSHVIFIFKNKVAVPMTFLYMLKAAGSFLKFLPRALQRRKPMTRKQFSDWRRLFSVRFSN
jgi:GT2 family glycosyltransferase